ncbi:metallophosphoesterase [Butyrivibrio sp. YAB3001]|uniref:metallophosphoesterase n=1 Tax=Butyrivibrio sp. YAB3001 TaxID=1520812 RepID=UPI0008F66DF1|nr:metallophosphoesterase [Butyrivibrio sp. YAB3001]SFC87053.1 hypothetical protein SAMN02910398_03370 [Butyrivibrio sp. YAB3001]
MNDRIVVTHYKSIGSKRIGIRLALISDLHNCVWDELIPLLKEEKPDAILCAGDILERHDENISEWTEEKIEKVISSVGKATLSEKIMYVLDKLVGRGGKATDEIEDIAKEFLQEASKVAPLFYSVGNHEWYFLEEDYEFFHTCGITLLDNEDCEAIIAGHSLRIGGLSTRYNFDWLKDFGEKTGYKILLCHHPEYYRKVICNKNYDTFDLIVSGHYHGGQCRIFGRAVYVPRTGLFVKGAVGQFGRHIISAGVANTTRFPRLGNPRELVMIEI